MQQSEETYDGTRAATIDWDLAFAGMENEMQQDQAERAQEKAKGKGKHAR